ncbi:MAG: hypothetical protein DRI46_09020 [Chloroflexi bacterium]|nr:MAG: hypothetical protein DRI46_09020 [Chloroflexota bacterium]
MTKMLKDNVEGEAGVAVSSNVVRVHGTKENYVAVDEHGTTINGPVSFVAGTEQIRFGALWTMNSELNLSIPSTLATPTAVMIVDPPVKQLAGIMEAAVLMIGILGIGVL